MVQEGVGEGTPCTCFWAEQGSWESHSCASEPENMEGNSCKGA